MIIIDNAVLSDDIAEKHFVCDLDKCKGACCVEGDIGAPLEEDELDQLDGSLEAIRPYLSPKGLKEIERQGAYILDEEGDYSTVTVGGRECAFSVYDEKGILKCAIEQAHRMAKRIF